MMLQTDLTYGQSAESLAQLTGVHVTTTRRWKRGGALPEPVKKLLRLQLARDLSVLSAAWDGWTISPQGLLVSPENWSFTPGEVRSIPLLHGSIAAQRGRANAAEDRLQCSPQADFIEGRFVEPGEMQGEPAARAQPITVNYAPDPEQALRIARRRGFRR